MPTAFNEAFRRVKELVADFKANESYFLSPPYSEAQARKDFIDKFFIALGWDVNHDVQKNPYAQEVKVERNESGTPRRADYAFFLAPNFHNVQFYVEAKKPHGEFGTSDNYFQALRYGWNGKTPLAVLTNFDEFHILDSRFKPHINDTLSRVVKRFSCSDYTDAEKFAEIYWLFSHEAVAANSLAKFAETLPKPKSRLFRRELFKAGEQSPDEAFLTELDAYREMLARAFKSQNPNLSSEQLTEVTQRTIDRLVFMRFLEDKQIEPARHVERFGADGGSVWEDFVRVSLNLDRIYNGVVFKRHEILDAPGFRIDEKPFRIICEELSDPTSPYNFATIPIHILGSIYERFLGKIITAGARIVEKPEVRKAGGVYYTPEYIVRYIVANTVGKAIEDKTPTEVAAMRFADIACGSGSFLIEVFDTLLRWHAKYHNENPGKVKKGDCVKRDDGLHLSLKRKQEILRNNIYGVDIDRQAVEVAQLSLYLKLLEDETIGSATEFQNEFHFTLLPSLADNIVYGNSLIGMDILESGKFTVEEEKKLNPMDFEQRFPNIFRRRRGNEPQTFKEESETPHVVSYNPGVGELREAAPGDVEHNLPGGMPLHGKFSYKRVKPAKITPEFEGGFDAIVGNPPYGADLSKEAGEYLRTRFETSTKDLDTYCLFIERAIRLVHSGGFISMIVPTGWYSGPKFSILRQFVASKTDPKAFINLPYDVFADAWVDTTVFVLARRQDVAGWPRKETCEVALRTFPKRHHIQSPDEFNEHLTKSDFAEWFAGGSDEYLTYADSLVTAIIKKISVRGKPFSGFADIQRGVTPFKLTDKPTHKSCRLAFDGAVRRYFFDPGEKKFIRFDESLAEFKPARYFSGSRILLRELISRQFRLQAVKVTGEFVTNKSMQNILPVPGGPDLSYLLGVLNSKLMSWYFLRRSNVAQRDDFPKIVLKESRQLPVASPLNKQQRDRMVSLVEKMLEARKQLSAALTDGDKDFYTRKCAGLDGQIDALVYELYGLTPEEIKIVEGENKVSVGQPSSDAPA